MWHFFLFGLFWFWLGIFCFLFFYLPVLVYSINGPVCYLHWERTSWRCFSSLSSSLEFEHTTLDLCVRVLITLYLQARLWWLSNWRYKSVWVGFLYTLVVRVPSSCGVTSVSRNGMGPSCLVSSVVKLMEQSTELLMEGSTEIMCYSNSSFCDCCTMTKVSSTYLFHNLWGFTADVRALCSKDSIYKFATIGLTRDPIAVPLVCS